MSLFSWIARWVISFLVWLSSDPHKIATEPARAAAAVAAASSSLAGEARETPSEVVPQ